jgi:hypothetical protein
MGPLRGRARRGIARLLNGCPNAQGRVPADALACGVTNRRKEKEMDVEMELKMRESEEEGGEEEGGEEEKGAAA